MIGSLLSTKRGYRNHPVVKLYAAEHMACLLSYHELTVAEFHARGWSGHKTPLSAEIQSLAALRATDETCTNWAQHVSFEVSHEALYPAQGWHLDMHDLVKRWSREGKTLRHPDVSEWVSWHALACHEACADRALKLKEGAVW